MCPWVCVCMVTRFAWRTIVWTSQLQRSSIRLSWHAGITESPLLPQPTLSRPLHARKYIYIYIMCLGVCACVLTLAGWRKSHCYFADIFIVVICARATAAAWRFEVCAVCVRVSAKNKKNNTKTIFIKTKTYSENPRNGVLYNAAVDSRSTPRLVCSIVFSRQVSVKIRSFIRHIIVYTRHRRYHHYFGYCGNT